MVPIRVAGTGYYVPEKILTNSDLEKTLDTTDEWILQRTGIRERRVAAPDQAASDMALPASLAAMKEAGVGPEDLDYIIMGTITPDLCCPSGANFLEAKLGAERAVSFDVAAACSGFVFIMDVARRYLQCGAAKTILVCAAEIMTRVQDWTDRANCVLWGDGAGAAVLKAEEGPGQLLDTYLGSDGKNGQNLLMPGGGSLTTPISYESVDAKKHTLRMIDANRQMKPAVKHFIKSVKTVLKQQGLSVEDVDHFIPHQANLRMIVQVAKFLRVPLEKFVVTIDKYANISSASSAIAFAEARDTGRIKKGDLCCFTVFGGGLTWGGALVQY